MVGAVRRLGSVGRVPVHSCTEDGHGRDLQPKIHFKDPHGWTRSVRTDAVDPRALFKLPGTNADHVLGSQCDWAAAAFHHLES